jgi:uncharacterized membrane protein YbhN (UPF0104 family)
MPFHLPNKPTAGAPSGRRRNHVLVWAVGAGVLALSAVLIARTLDLGAIKQTLRAALGDFPGAALALVLYAAAFVIRAALWSRVLPELPFAHALAGLHVALGGNHVLPFRLGEALRVTSVVRRTRVSLGAATASTIMLRGADMVAVVGLAALLGSRVLGDLLGPWAWALAGPSALLWAAGLWWLRRLRVARLTHVRTSTFWVATGAAAAWVLESAVLWQAAEWAGLQVDYAQAVLVTAVTIAAQVVAIAPAGIGTYEAAGTAAFVALGADPAPALAAALTAHALKTAYALTTGAIALFVPSPGALGRLRLPFPTPAHPKSSTDGAHVGDAPKSPVVFFFPARDEEATVGDIIRRVPDTVLGHPVVRVVIDDGSVDRTAEAAVAGGADVISLSHGRGLGAAVRVGIAEGVRRGATGVVFCDADGEYRPEEIEPVMAPILDGTADYVVGTRLGGTVERMLPHRRMGNVVLTKLLSHVARTSITDGQSGYRALSCAAAREAEIIHDFNYAQVLTLDLLAKGFRYVEVPITYRFRTTGRSFVRLGKYLREVIPAVHREINELPALTRR